jgi:hypothetical protein
MRCAPPHTDVPRRNRRAAILKVSDNLHIRPVSYERLPGCLVGLVDVVDLFSSDPHTCQNMRC